MAAPPGQFIDCKLLMRSKRQFWDKKVKFVVISLLLRNWVFITLQEDVSVLTGPQIYSFIMVVYENKILIVF